MNLEKFKTDTRLFSYFLMGLAIVFALMFLFIFGFAIIFFVILIGWAILVFYYLRFLVRYNFTARVVAIILAVFLTLGIFFWAYNSPTIKKLGKSTTSGPRLESCTSSANTEIGSVDDISVNLYSGALDQVKGSPEPEDATSTRVFSLKALTDKTSNESFYFKMAPSKEGGSIKGYDELMEVCNLENKGSSTYITKNTSGENGAVKEDNVTSRWSYFHGGKYILEPGDYRVDGYVWSPKTKKWTLVARETGITITE